MANDDYILSHYANVAKQFGLSPLSSIEDQSIRDGETQFFKEAIQKIIKGLSHLDRPIQILDVGCGNGITIELLSKSFPHIHFTGLEFCPELLDLCLQRKLPQDKINFIQGDMRENKFFKTNSFDIILSQRSLINILGKQKQVMALQNIAAALTEHGHYLLSESFYESWANLNHARAEFQMEEMPISKHNLFLTESRLQTLTKSKMCEYHHDLGRFFLSTHFYLTRVVHPLLRRPGDRGVAPHFVKFLSEAMGPNIGDYSPIQFRWFEKN